MLPHPPRRIALEVVHHPLGRGVSGGNDRVDVRGPNVQGVELPAAVGADVNDRVLGRAAGGFVERDGGAGGLVTLETQLFGIVGYKRLARFVVVTVDGAAGVAVEAGALGGEGKEVGR